MPAAWGREQDNAIKNRQSRSAVAAGKAWLTVDRESPFGRHLS